jgi:oligo-1,6-glucosidase
MLTDNSRIKDVYAHPIGKDVFKKVLLLAGRDDGIIKNPLVSQLKLKTLPKLSGNKIDSGFIRALLELLNGEKDLPGGGGGTTPAWWKEAVFYQIYPRSFKDQNGDGIGDLRGITAQLDYLKALGVDALWLSPIYDSPNDDNGYDIRDYRNIMAEFGTMEDFDELLEGVHASGMRLIMDLVVNHTSDEHPWFQKALTDPGSKYGDYYIFRDRPNNWTSFFGGSVWRFYEARGLYALHLFSQKQPDLNWESPQVRREVHELVRWWLQKGVDGFRMDVVNFISKRYNLKDGSLPDGDERIGTLTGHTGMEHYFYGPRLHEYLKELKKEAFAPFNAFSVGETPGIGMEMSKLLTADDRAELDMIFSFDHLETPGHDRFDDYRYDLNYYKAYISDWMENYGPRCWMSLFYDNHDNPRMVSKVDPDPRYREVLAKLLATMQLTLRGTPFIFQGQELGMVNRDFSSMDELRDIESINLYKELKKTMSEAEAFKKILAGTRDHARIPMQWTDSMHGGFSEPRSSAEPAAPPWLEGGSDYACCNAAAQAADRNSVLNHYKELIRLRKAHDTFIYGDIRIVNKQTKNLLTYWRTNGREAFFIECNLSREPVKRRDKLPGAVLALSNYPDAPGAELRAYEAVLWKDMIYRSPYEKEA